MLPGHDAERRKVCADFDAELRDFNDHDDHVHLLVDYPPRVAISALVNNPKRVSAGRLRSRFTGQVNRHIMHSHFWSPSYLTASCGAAPPGIIRWHIEQQRTPAQATSRPTPAQRTRLAPGNFGHR